MSGVSKFLENLNIETWAVVYAYNPPANTRNLWYDRWRFDVINDYVKSVSNLGVEPFIVDIDSFMRMSQHETANLDFVINLNSGATPIPNIGTVQSVASWHQIPSFPNTADAVMVGERKDICTPFFSQWFNVPEPVKITSGSEASIKTIMKPKTLGNSRGILVLEKGDLVPDHFSHKAFGLESFIPGYEVSIPVIFDPLLSEYRVMAPVIYVPNVDDPENWYLSDEAKFSKREFYGRRLGSASEQLISALKEASHAFQFGDIARFDFRWKTTRPEDAIVEPDDLVFIEINCLPTLNENVNFLLSVDDHLKDDNSDLAEHAKSVTATELSSLTYLLLNSRYRSFKTK